LQSRGLFAEVPDKFILTVHEYDLRYNRPVGQLETHYDYFFAGFYEVRCCPIHADGTGATFAEDNIGFKPGAGSIARY